MRVENLIITLKEIVNDPVTRKQKIAEFQEEMWTSKGAQQPSRVFTILRDLAYNLDYYEADPSLRREDPSYYGEERLKDEISSALKTIEGLEAGPRGSQ